MDTIFPKDIIKFLEKYNFNIKIDDFNVYTLENNIIDTAIILNDGNNENINPEYLRWETVENGDIIISG